MFCSFFCFGGKMEGFFFPSSSTFRFLSIFSYSWLCVAFTSFDLLLLPLSESISSVAGNISARYPNSLLRRRLPGSVLRPPEASGFAPCTCSPSHINSSPQVPKEHRTFCIIYPEADSLKIPLLNHLPRAPSLHIFLYHPSLISPAFTPQDLC